MELNHHVAIPKSSLKQQKHYNAEMHLSVLLEQMGSEHNTCHKLAVKEGLGNELSISLFKDTV